MKNEEINEWIKDMPHEQLKKKNPWHRNKERKMIIKEENRKNYKI